MKLGGRNAHIIIVTRMGGVFVIALPPVVVNGCGVQTGMNGFNSPSQAFRRFVHTLGTVG